MLESIEVSTVLPATPQRLYTAWLNADEHTAMTGGNKAMIDPTLGGEHTAWDGYIWGENFELEPFSRIVQSWRSAEFPKGSIDSRLEIRFEKVVGGTKLTLIHSDIPAGQGDDYKSGWDESYFQPMKKYFKPVKKSIVKAAAKRTTKPGQAKPTSKAKSVASRAKKTARRK